MFAVGAGGAIAGYRADLIIIDDPVRSREEAFSESARDKLYEWFVTDLLPRLRPGGTICLISTRWHEDDLFGRLAASGGYEIVSLSAVAEEDDPLGRPPGEFLWDLDPEYPYGEFLRAQRQAQLPSSWSALFQQRPAPEQGDYFRAEWFRPYTTLPSREQMHIMRSVQAGATTLCTWWSGSTPAANSISLISGGVRHRLMKASTRSLTW